MHVCRIEETWRLWQKFLDDYSRFEEWLKVSERTAALPNSSGVLYTVAKEELKKFEVRSCWNMIQRSISYQSDLWFSYLHVHMPKTGSVGVEPARDMTVSDISGTPDLTNITSPHCRHFRDRCRSVWPSWSSSISSTDDWLVRTAQIHPADCDKWCMMGTDAGTFYRGELPPSCADLRWHF